MALIDQLRQDSRLADASDEELLGLLAQHPQYRNLSDSALRYAAFGKLEGAKPEANSEPGFVAGVSAGVDQMQAMGGGLLMAAGEKLGSESTWNAGRDVYDRNMAEAGENALGYGFTDLFTNPDTSAWQWAKYTAGNLLPTMATAVASGGVGGAGARLLAGTVAKRAATQAGQAIGAYGASAGMETGAIMGETNDADVALAHGSIAGALDALPVMRALRKVGGKQIADEAASEIADQTLNQLRRTADQSIKGAAGRGLLTQALAESSTEGLQTLIEQHAKYWVENNGQSLFNNLGEANWKEVIDAAAAGGLMGGAMGAPAGIVERGRSQSAVTAEEQRRDNQTPSEQEGDADPAPVQSANVGDRPGRDAWSEYDTPPAQRARQRKDQAINQARRQAAASGGDALSQAQAAQQAEQMADEVTRQEQAEQAPQRAAQLGNRIQMTLDAAADLEGLARGSDQGQARLRNLQSVLNRAETAYDSGNLDLAERLTARAEGITQNLTAALNRAGSRERPLVGQLDEPDQFAGLIGQDSAPRLSAPDPSVINMGGPTADTTQYEPQARTVRRDERMTAQREGEARLREQMARQRPQLADQGIVYGEGPVDTRREDARLRTQRAFEQQQGREPYWGRNGEYLGPDPLPDTPEREGATYSGEAVRRPSRIEGRGTPRLPDEGTIFGSGPVAGNANTGMDQPFERARMTDTGARTNADQQRAEMGRQAQRAADVARTRGPVETAYLPDNTPVRTRYRVMDLAELTPSNTEDGRVNPTYPAELQPRDRTNSNSQVQVRNIAANLNPERLGRSQDAATGAPIVGADGVVESGNGRTMAIGQAYRQGRGEAYRQYVAREAATMGMDPAAVESMERPVLVRERITNVDRADFARRANESTVAGMTSYEQAQADAAALSEADIQSWAPDQTGDPLAASNRSFQRAFVSRLGNNEASRYTTRDGQASPELGTRMQRAVFAKAYADSDMVEMVTEQGEAMRNLAAALQTAAADLAIARDTGSEDALTAIGTINDAVRLVRRSRQDGTSIRELISQQDVFSDSVPALTADLALAINTNMRSRRALSEAMRYIGQIVRQRAESERNGALFEDTTTNRDVIDEGFRQADAEQRTSSTDVSRSDRQGESAQSPDRAERAPAGPQARALRGQPLDNEWTAFSEASGTLGIPRADMPQIKAEHRGALANFLSARDIDSTEATVPASSLRPTQREFSENRVQSAKGREGGDRAILVSSDGYVVDGHHQWLAKVDQGDDVRVIQLGAPIDRVLEAAREFPSSEVDTDSALLTTYTEQDIADRERTTAAAMQDEQRQRQAEAQRAQADRDAGDFTLTGSNRSADVAAAQGQEDLIGANGGDRQSDPTTPGGDAATASQPASSRPEKIDDFGEKLEGARKDYARRIRESLATEVNADTKVSDVFPKLDYQKLIDAGMSKESAAFMAVLRTSIPAKPRRGFKLKRWVQALDGAREIGQSVMDGKVSGEQLFNQVSDGQQSPAWESQALTAQLISGLEPAQFDQAAKWRVDARAGYSLFMGEEVSPNQKFYSLKDDKGRTTGIWSDSFAGIEESARDAVAGHLRKNAGAGPRSRQTKINVYRDTRDGDRFIAFKNGSRVVRLRGGFASVAEASDYIHDNRDALQSEIDEMRRGPEMRNKTNAERMGESVRDGDVSPEQFSDTFGFRGVQFGNYVEGGRRQRDLNDAHDALMDLADTLGIPPKGLSLNGTLGLAFGARGKGGKRPAMAHYEPGQVVINLTKGKGAGSLAHEWFHALDNYIPDGQGHDVFQSDKNADTAARVDLAMRWSEMRNVLRDSGFQERSRKLDEARSKPYFGTPIEMAARAFEAYIKQRLGERGIRNDYLVNTIETSPAYPTEAEMASITPAFDRLIGTLEYQDTDSGVQLYSMRGAPTGGASPTADSVRSALEPMREELGDFTVVETAGDLPLASQLRLLRDGVDGGDVRGLYSGDRLYIVAGNNESLQRAVTTAVHEAVGHKGIRGVLGDEIEPVMRQLFKSLPLDRRGREALQEVLNTYTFLDRDNPDHQVMIAEEMVAHLLEKGYRPKVWQRVVAKIRELLRRIFPSMGWTYTDVLALGERSRDFLRSQQSSNAGDEAYSLRPRRQSVAEQFNDLSPETKAFMAKFGSRTPTRRAMDWYRDLTNRAMLRIRQGLVDQYAALKELDEKRFGKDGALEESITSSSWVLARMSNAANGALHSMLHNGRIYLDPDQKVIDIRDDDSKGLGAVLGQLGSPAEIERFMMWIAANRSNKLSDEGREFLFSDGEIRAGMQLNEGHLADGSSRRERYRKAFDEFQEYRDDVLAIAEQSGIIRPDQRAMWRDEFYVPFYRLKDDKDVNVQLGTSGLSRQQAFKRLKGGTENINDLLQNTMMNFHHLLDASLKNQAAQQAIENAEAMGMAHRVPESNRDTSKSTFVMKNGAKAFYEIDDPMVFSAVSALAHAGMNNVIMKVMRGFKRVFTNMTTTTPQFIVANLMRDTMQAVATNDVSKNVFKNIYDGAGTLRDQRKRARMLASGANFNFGHLYSNNPDELRAQLTRNLRDAKVIGAPGSSMGGFAAPAQLLRAGWAKWGDMNDFAENLNRAAIYEQNQDRGKLKAAFEARDLVDFSARGAWPAVRILTDIVPFLNARIQGLDKIYRSGVKPGANVLAAAFGKGQAGVSDKQAAARFWSVAGAVTMATVALYLNNHDDEDYQELEEWQKDTYWFFKVGDQAFFIPKPFEVGAIATMAERMTQQFVDDEATGSLFAQRLGHMLTDTFSFSPVPQMFQPALDIYSNRDSFTDRPIEGMGDQRLSPELRKRSSTSRVAQGASLLLNNTVGAIGNPETNPMALSPLQIDHLIQGYLGQIGAWAAGSVDVAWKTFDGKDEPASRWYEYQPVRRFYSNLGDEPRYTRYGTVFYEGLREAERAYADVKELGEMGRLDEARALARTNADMLRLRKPLMRAQRKLNSVRKQIEAIRRSDLGGELKRQRIDRLTAVKNRIQKALGEEVLEQRAAQ